MKVRLILFALDLRSNISQLFFPSVVLMVSCIFKKATALELEYLGKSEMNLIPEIKPLIGTRITYEAEHITGGAYSL